jgi:hypothetical protein
MKTTSTRILIAAGILTAAFLGGSASLFAQAAPGPLHPTPQASDDSTARSTAPAKQYPVEKKENLIGTWIINADQSDNAHEKIAQARGRLPGGGGGSNPNPGAGNPPNSGGPYPGNGPGGNGPYGRPGSGQPYPGNGPGNGPSGSSPSGRRGPYSSSPTLEDRQQMQDLIEPATSLALTQKDAEVDVTDDQGRKRVYFTDGRKPQKSKDENYQEASARWDGARLITDEKGLHGGSITRTFDLTSDGQQLEEIVRLDSTHRGSVTVRYVFDILSAPPRAPAAK